MGKSDRMRVIELERGKAIEQLLREMAADGLTLEQIATELNVSSMTVRRWLKDVRATLIVVREIKFPDSLAEAAGAS